MVSRKAVRASPAVIRPARSTINTESALRVASLNSIEADIVTRLRVRTSVLRPGEVVCPLSLLRHPVDNRFQDGIGINPFGFAFEIQNDPMSKRRQYNMADVLKGHFRPAVQKSTDFSADGQRLRAARAGTVPKELLRL